MDNIPSEVFSIIYSHLEAKDIYQCLQVCKSWHPQAIQSFWKEATIYSRRIRELRDYLYEDSTDYFKYGHLTRKMIFEPPKKSYDQLLTSCGLEESDEEENDREENDREENDREESDEEKSDEEKSDKEESKNEGSKKEKSDQDESDMEYSEGDSDLEEECDMFTFTDVKRLMEYFPNVEEIQIGDERYREYLYSFIDIDLKCIKKFTNITNSVIFDYLLYDAYAAACWNFKDTLTSVDFKYTPKSRIVNNELYTVSDVLSKFTNLTELTFRNDFDPIMNTIIVQAGCPNLTTFNYESKLPIIDIFTEKRLDMLEETALYHINRNINKLYLTLPNFPANFIKYLIKYLPNKMEKIYLDIKETNLYSWIDEVGDELTSKFMEKLRNVKNVVIFFSETDSDYMYSDTDEIRMTKYFKLVNALRGDRKPYCVFSTLDYLPNRHSFIYDENGKLDLTYGLDLPEDFIMNWEESPRYLEFNPPDTTVSGIGLEIVDEMIFNYADDGDIDIPYLVFDYITKKCPNVLEFEILNSESPYSSIRANSRRFKTLKTSEKRFSDVTLTNVVRYEEIINLLTTYTPNVTHMASEYDFDCNHCDPYNTDLTGLTKLQCFIFDLELKDLAKIHCLIINFKYTDGEETQFCYHVPIRKITSLEKNFDFGIDITDTITFKCDKKQKIILRACDNIVGAFFKGELLNMDYPIELDYMRFPQ